MFAIYNKPTKEYMLLNMWDGEINTIHSIREFIKQGTEI